MFRGRSQGLFRDFWAEEKKQWVADQRTTQKKQGITRCYRRAQTGSPTLGSIHYRIPLNAYTIRVNWSGGAGWIEGEFVFSGCYGDVGWHWGACRGAIESFTFINEYPLLVQRCLQHLQQNSRSMDTDSELQAETSKVQRLRKEYDGRVNRTRRQKKELATLRVRQFAHHFQCIPRAFLFVSLVHKHLLYRRHCNVVVCLGHIERLPAGC